MLLINTYKIIKVIIIFIKMSLIFTVIIYAAVNTWKLLNRLHGTDVWRSSIFTVRATHVHITVDVVLLKRHKIR